MARTGRILVVDDEVNARTALAELLREEGFEVETAADAFKALGKYETFAPHVVVTDLKMPGMDGIELDKKLETEQLRRETRQLRARVRDRVAPGNIVGTAPPMQRVFEIIDQVAPSKATVLITGESGTGKELVANAIHQRSPRTGGPFIHL